MGKIRVVIADDSSVARGLLRDFLEGDEDIEVIGEACNGRQAVDMAHELKPDLITMDLEMPVMTGFQAIEEIMCSRAVPILVVSSVADAQNALAAVGCGALEVVRKPDYSPTEAADFVAKVRMLAGVSVITRMRPRMATTPPAVTPAAAASPVITAPIPQAKLNGYRHVFAIACSTGGPAALAQILPALPADFPCPVLIAQHISDGFAQGMADWLSSLCKLPVRLAAEGDFLQAGVIYISPSERHLRITTEHGMTLVERGMLDLFHPSCDVMLDSIADIFGRQAVGIILTGMSSDGASGIARIREKGGVTLAQDEASSVIYGMNRIAIEAGNVQHILSVEAIAQAMTNLAKAEGGR
jgi:two-component system chemotaxis response regulator CheB